MRRCDIWGNTLKDERIGEQAMALLISMPGESPVEAVVAVTPSTVQQKDEIAEGARLYIAGDLAGTIEGRIWIRALYLARIEPGVRESEHDGPSYADWVEGIVIPKEKVRSRTRVEREGAVL